MTDRTFNLLSEPWIEVLLLDGSTATVSLTEAFTRAHEIRTISGEVVTQHAAILRLMLAILYRVIPDSGPPEEIWRDWWERERFDVTDLEPYLSKYADRFDLVGDDPFFQVADLHTATGDYASLARLIADVPPKDQYFTTRTQDSYDSMDLAEAARWVVHAQAFDPSGIKSGAVGDEDRVKGGKGYPIGIANSGWLGLVILEGSTLFETLLLNLDLEARTRRDSAVWERDPQGPAEEGRAAPTGPADLLTWQSRRIRLFLDGDRAVGALLCNGDQLHPRNLHAVERMTAWRRSAAQEKAHGIPKVLMPQSHLPDRSAWRGLSSLLCVSAEGEPTEGEQPGVLHWVNQLVREEVLPDSLVICVRTVGVEYGSNSSVISHLIADSLVLPAVVCQEQRFAALAVQGVEDAERAVRALGDLAKDLALAQGWSPESSTEVGAARDRVRTAAFHSLEKQFASWLLGFTPDMDREQARVEWQRQVCREVVVRARSLVGVCGSVADKGRMVKVNSKEKERFYNTAVADKWFWDTLRQELPGAFAKTSGEESNE